MLEGQSQHWTPTSLDSVHGSSTTMIQRDAARVGNMPAACVDNKQSRQARRGNSQAQQPKVAQAVRITTRDLNLT